jgi:hypothetical protein
MGLLMCIHCIDGRIGAGGQLHTWWWAYCSSGRHTNSHIAWWRWTYNIQRSTVWWWRLLWLLRVWLWCSPLESMKGWEKRERNREK